MMNYIKKQSTSNGVAIVLGTGVNGLGHIRSLGVKGIKVYAIYSAKKDTSLGRFSKFCKSIYIPENDDFEQKLEQKLISLAKNLSKKPVLFASSDYYVEFISRFEDTLKKYLRFNIPSKNVLNIILNKKLISDVATNIGISCPEFYNISTRQDLFTLYKTINYPCIVKPEDSYTIAFPGKNFIATNSSELLLFFKEHPAMLGKCVVQEIVPGDEMNIYQYTGYFGVDLQLIQGFSMQKIHQFPPDFGINTLGRSKKIGLIGDLTEKILKPMGYSGFFSAEFKQHSINKKYYLIEINPRLPWYNSLFTFSNINFPHISFMHLMFPDKKPNTPLEQKDGCYWLYFRNELAGYYKRKTEGKNITFKDYWKYLLREKCYAFWEVGDPLPFFMATVDFFRWFVCKLFRNLTT